MKNKNTNILPNTDGAKIPGLTNLDPLCYVQGMWKMRDVAPEVSALAWEGCEALHGLSTGLFKHEHVILEQLAGLTRSGNKALCLGCGMLNIPNRLPDLDWTIVEIDPDVISLARFKLPSALFIHADANLFARDCPTRFDLIYVDIFKPDAEQPAFRASNYRHLLHLLNPGAHIVANVFGRNTFSPAQYIGQVCHIIDPHFSQVDVVSAAPNTLLFAKSFDDTVGKAQAK